MASKGNGVLVVLGGRSPILGQILMIGSLAYSLLHQLWAFATEQPKSLPMCPLVQSY